MYFLNLTTYDELCRQFSLADIYITTICSHSIRVSHR